jgi:hypothetical protein
MRRAVVATLLVTAGALLPAPRGASRSVARRLAPRDVLEAEFDRLAQGQPVVVVDAAAAAPLLAELIDDGDLGTDELRQMWGPGARDRAGFVALCEAVGDLFEDEDEEVVAAPAAAAPAPAAVAAPAPAPAPQAAPPAAPAAAPAPARVETLSDPRFDAPAAPRTAPPAQKQAKTPVAALLRALPATCAYPDPDDPEAPTYDQLTALCKDVAAIRDEAQRGDLELVDLLTGTWELAFTSSPSFAFNKGFTGVAGTLPGGADFVSLTQTISDSVDAVVYVETIAPQIGVDELDVTVASDWGLNRRFDALQRCQRVYVDCLPRKVTYGPVTVDGKRVERGWKSMRVMNALAVEYIDDDVRVMQGTTAYFVFRKVT